jgi:hypothetical protein
VCQATQEIPSHIQCWQLSQQTRLYCTQNAAAVYFSW